MSQTPIDEVQRTLCQEICALLSLEPGAVNADTDLTVLGIDSLRFVSLMIAIEQKFGVSLMKIGIKPDDTKSVRNLSAVIRSGQSA